MSFDRATRNALAKMVGQARERLKADVVDQLRRLGFQEDGTVLDLGAIAGLTDEERAAGQELRALLEHFVALERGAGARKAAYDRLAREVGFTTLNRLAALRMAEERGLIVQSVGRGLASEGFQVYERVAGGALGNRAQTYRAYLERLYDELALDLPLLFDRGDPRSRVFPGERCLEDVLGWLNDADLAHLWKEDETIGWIYQYYNDPVERKQMREAAAPRNSRELAVRNQFFTPRYVVEFLTDNTLGRIWYEMRRGDTRLSDECRYLVRRPTEIFLRPGESPPRDTQPDDDVSQEALLKRPEYIRHRAKKDPRELKVLDPACGSGHFLLYAFDLLETIYDEAYDDPDLGPSLRREYPDRALFRRETPWLILRHNLHGVDIDPRACQIAALSLWLRTQRSYQTAGIKPADRPRITRTNIVCAEPMPGERVYFEEFLQRVDERLRPLAEQVWERMCFAGDAGSLLKIEEDIRNALDEARARALVRPRQMLFSGMTGHEQPPLPLASDSEMHFWVTAERQLIDVLEEYATLASDRDSTQRRMFAEDAARGFAYIDLCFHRYDVVLMNPPFGDLPVNYKKLAREVYPDSHNDMFASFIDRFVSRMYSNGLLGSITSRSGLFLSSFARWRQNVLLARTTLRNLADLGGEVMDDAMVESSVYCLQDGHTYSPSANIRLLSSTHREEDLSATVGRMRTGEAGRQLLITYPDHFGILPESPFVYWVSGETIRKVTAHNSFEPSIGEVRQGLVTGDNERFVRNVWEVSPARMTGGQQALEAARLGNDAMRRTLLAQLACKAKWVPHVMSGDSQPWFSPLTVVVNWENDGRELRGFFDKSGKLRSRPQNVQYYFRPGFSWTRRALRFIPYAVPSGCIPTASRYMAFPKQGKEFEALSITASNVASAFLRFYGEWFTRPNFLVENVKVLPIPEVPEPTKVRLELLAKEEVSQRRRAYQNHEPFQEFTAPLLCFPNPMAQPLSFDLNSLLGAEFEAAVAQAYGLDEREQSLLEQDVRDAVAVRRSSADRAQGESSGDDQDFVLVTDRRGESESLVSYLVGCAFGRWDVRIGCDPDLAPKLPDPFDPLPLCPPGMLVGPDGLPASRGRIVSTDWLRVRPNAITLPLAFSPANAPIADEEYPLALSWDGILVDDASQPTDIVARVREALRLLRPGGHDAADVECEACDLLRVRDLREYFGRATSFFADHLKRYSKSHRQSPIYWPLSTASCSYTIWLYYHRLTSETLFTAVNCYIEPKIAEVERQVREMTIRLGDTKGREAAALRGQLEQTTGCLAELTDFRAELLRVAALPYRPNLDDGVLINAAPLHQLFRLPKWAKDTRECWDKLQRGDYDWAHLAYTLWPERVEEKCRSDLSLAIAHGFEDRYSERPVRTSSRRRLGAMPMMDVLSDEG